MKIIFRGWGREVYPHDVDVIPVTKTEGAYHPKDGRRSLKWADGMTVFGKIEGVELTGSFLAEFRFTEAELRDWLQNYLSAEPERALQMISNVQTVAIRRLTQKGKARLAT